MKRIGIFGGTFNPFHNGHKHILTEVQKAIDFDVVCVIPCKIPPHKTVEDLASDEDRFNMATIATSNIPKTKVLDIELKREGKSYTIDTVKEFYRYAQERKSKIYLIIGSDMLFCFDKWKDYEGILERCTLVCVARSDEDISKCKEYVKEYNDKYENKIIYISIKPLDISSSEIREAYSREKGRVVAPYLDELVEKYISERGLYNGKE